MVSAAQGSITGFSASVMRFLESIEYRRVDNAADLEKALAAGPAADRPLVIGATIDPAQYAAQF